MTKLEFTAADQSQMWTGGGVQIPETFADVIYEWPLTGQYLLKGEEVMGASSKPETAMESGLPLPPVSLILGRREKEFCSGEDSGLVVDVWRHSSEMGKNPLY